MKSIYLVITVALVMMLAACEKGLFEAEPENNPEALFEDFWNNFNNDYASFQIKGIDWQEVYNKYRPQVSPETTDDELAEILFQMIKILDDGHVTLIVPGKEIYYSDSIYRDLLGEELFDLELVKSDYMTEAPIVFKYDDMHTYGWIGNVGYLHIKGLRDNILEMNDILDYFGTAKGLIIDLRGNLGGDFTYAMTEFVRLSDEKRLIFSSRTKTGKGIDDYTDWYDWYLEPEGKFFDKPIVLLTDRITISAGERAAMVLKSLPNVTHLGDTTNGAAATKIGKELANGWAYSVICQQLKFNDGFDYEDSGLPPDIYMKNSEEDIKNGQDKTLEAALELLK